MKLERLNERQRNVSSSGLMDLALPYPLPFKNVKNTLTPFSNGLYRFPTGETANHLYKEEKFNLVGYGPDINLPHCVGELVIMLFLEIKDIVKLFSVSKDLRNIAINSLSFLSKIFIFPI
eukprot:maker-scaffold_41-snap-gene-2.32-mRNA-1 protein AED:0.00 eAED:0.00 QI:95/0.66/0.75/1/1/0.75/4/1781/119